MSPHLCVTPVLSFVINLVLLHQMLFPVPIQHQILEDCDLETLGISSLVCKDWCERSHMIIAKKIWGSSYANNWIDLVRDKNSRNKPQVIDIVILLTIVRCN